MKTYAKWWVALSLAGMLAGCGAPGPAAIGTASDDASLAVHSLSVDDRARTGEAIEELSNTFADDVAITPLLPSKLGDRGGLLYRAFDHSSLLRKAAYAVADVIVRRHFSKPGKQDDIPPLTPAQRAQVSAALQPGDVIQCGNNSSFVHAAFYLGDDTIVHALAQAGNGKKMIGVLKESWSGYLERVHRDKVVVLRPHWTPEALATAREYALAQVGKDYDTLFMTDGDERLYCTELIYATLNKAGVARVEPHKAAIGWRIITNEDLRRSSDLQLVLKINHD